MPCMVEDRLPAAVVLEESRAVAHAAGGWAGIGSLACGRLELGLWPCGRLDTMVSSRIV